MHPERIADLIDKCREAGVDSFSWTDRNGANVTLRFHGARVEVALTPAPDGPTMQMVPEPQAPSAGPEPLMADVAGERETEPDWCACGHSIGVEHNAVGQCLRGCEDATCASGPPADEKPRGS